MEGKDHLVEKSGDHRDISARQHHRNDSGSGNLHSIDLAGYKGGNGSVRLDVHEFDFDSFSLERGGRCGHPHWCHGSDGRYISRPKLSWLLCCHDGGWCAQNRQSKRHNREKDPAFYRKHNSARLLIPKECMLDGYPSKGHPTEQR